MSTPRTVTVPAVARWSPSTISRAVVLPAPLGPRIPKTSPRYTVKEMSSTAVREPYRLTNSLTSITSSMAMTDYNIGLHLLLRWRSDDGKLYLQGK